MVVTEFISLSLNYQEVNHVHGDVADIIIKLVVRNRKLEIRRKKIENLELGN